MLKWMAFLTTEWMKSTNIVLFVIKSSRIGTGPKYIWPRFTKMNKKELELKELAEDIYDLYALSVDDLLPVLFKARLFGLVKKINKITGVDKLIEKES